MRRGAVSAICLSGLAFASCVPPSDTPLTAAVQSGDVDVVRSLIEQDRVDVDERGYAGWTPLFVAVMDDELEIAKLLLAAGADVNRRSVSWFYTGDSGFPLKRAALRRNTEMLKLLLESGADVDAKDSGPKETALMGAASMGSPEEVELLIAYGADVNARSRNGRTPLMFAATGRERGNVWTRENARILIERGADIEARTIYGGRALHQAAYSNDVPVLLLLLDHGARTDVRDDTGVTPLGSAAMSGRLEAVHVLVPFFRGDRSAIDEAVALAREYRQEATERYLLKVALPGLSSP